MASNKLAIPKGKKVKAPFREPDMHSKRGIPYWFGPEWVRQEGSRVDRIVALKVKGDIELHRVSKDGNVTYIQGSIQQEFLAWHEDRQIDAILLGMDEDEIIETTWEYE
jgi:hypothetical protein